LRRLVDSLYSRNENEFNRGNFRVKGETIDVFLAYSDYAYRIIFWGDEVEELKSFDPGSGLIIEELENIAIYPANIFVTTRNRMMQALSMIQVDLGKQIEYFKEVGKHGGEFTEGWGQLLNLSVFFLFGLLVVRAWPQFNGMHLLYACLSLTVVRMVPVAVALWGTRLSSATVLFMGWFGPRGLASIVLGLVYLEHAMHQESVSTIRLAVMATVFLSIFAHGLSAAPGMKLYARKIAALEPSAPEHEGG
jgi:hypothetical protein